MMLNLCICWLISLRLSVILRQKCMNVCKRLLCLMYDFFVLICFISLVGFLLLFTILIGPVHRFVYLSVFF